MAEYDQQSSTILVPGSMASRISAINLVPEIGVLSRSASDFFSKASTIACFSWEMVFTLAATLERALGVRASVRAFVRSLKATLISPSMPHAIGRFFACWKNMDPMTTKTSTASMMSRVARLLGSMSPMYCGWWTGKLTSLIHG